MQDLLTLHRQAMFDYLGPRLDGLKQHVDDGLHGVQRSVADLKRQQEISEQRVSAIERAAAANGADVERLGNEVLRVRDTNHAHANTLQAHEAKIGVVHIERAQLVTRLSAVEQSTDDLPENFRRILQESLQETRPALPFADSAQLRWGTVKQIWWIVVAVAGAVYWGMALLSRAHAWTP